MRALKRGMGVGSLALLLGGMLLATGCTKYASEENLAELDNAKKAVTSAERTLSDRRGELSELQRELQVKKGELTAAEEELANLQRQLDE